MIQIPAKIDVGQLKSILLQRRITKPRFRLPMSPQQAYDSLLAATIAEVEYRCRSFQENVDVKAQLQQIANWLTSDSSKFGILLCGECGNGKSTLVKAFQQLLNLLSIPNPTGQGNYGIDALGTEPQEVMDFGNVVTPVIDLLTKRYDEQLFTIITTNLTPKQIREHYGDRIADRLNEMVEKIIFKNGTYRFDKSLI